MERIEIAALSKIADILTDNNKSPLFPQVDIWKKIFFNAEMGELFEHRGPQFTIVIQSYGYRPDERDLYFNEKTYNGLFESFQELQYSMDELVKLLNSIAGKMSLFKVLLPDIEERIIDEYPKSKRIQFEDFFAQVDDTTRNDIINKHCVRSFRELRRNLNILGLEIIWMDESFTIVPFTSRSEQSDFDLNIINQWLHSKYFNVYESYEAARKAFANGDAVGCITHCRNIITGIFSYKKDDGREWYNGLQKICCADKNITSITNAKSIPTIKYDVHSQDVKQRYKYPRFNLINKLYVLTCDLGAHINEGNVGVGTVDSEVATMEDALWALRGTEDMLIWVYQTGNMDR